MGGWFWPSIGLLLGVAACSGPRPNTRTRSRGATRAPRPAGTPARRQDGGGTFLAPSGVTLGGYQGDDWDASIAGDDGGVGLPPRIGGDAAWTNAVPGGMPQVVNSGGPTVTSPVFQSVTFATTT